MMLRSLKTASKAVVLTLVIGPLAFAQVAGTGQADVTQRAKLPPREMLAESATYIEKMKSNIANIESIHDLAVRGQDIMKANCVHEKLVQANANINVASKAAEALEIAVRRNDEAAAVHEFTRITITEQRVDVLAAEAKECVGEEIGQLGSGKPTVSVGADVRRDSVTAPVVLPTAYVERPPVASPFN